MSRARLSSQGTDPEYSRRRVKATGAYRTRHLPDPTGAFAVGHPTRTKPWSGKWAAQVLVFISFFPYPALLTPGRSVGLQLGQLLCAAIVIALFARVVRTRSWRAFLALTTPVLIATALLQMLNRNIAPDLAVKGALTIPFILLCLPAFGVLLQGRRSDWLVTPVSLAVLGHFIVGLLQLRGFSNGTFVFIDYFRNPSFSDLAPIAQELTDYVRRPFGLFPEPSAMAAAIGPWIAWLLYQGLSRRSSRALPVVASICGFALTLLSGSVYAAFLVAGVATLILLQPGLQVLWKGAIALAGVAVLASSLSTATWFDRTVDKNVSRDYRLGSIQAALQVPLDDPLFLLLGRGVGQLGAVFEQIGAPYVATYSLIALGFATGGMLFLAAALLVVVMVSRRLRNWPMRTVAAMLLVSLAVTTSYLELLPMWLMLAMLLDADSETLSTPQDGLASPSQGPTLVTPHLPQQTTIGRGLSGMST